MVLLDMPLVGGQPFRLSMLLDSVRVCLRPVATLVAAAPLLGGCSAVESYLNELAQREIQVPALNIQTPGITVTPTQPAQPAATLTVRSDDSITRPGWYRLAVEASTGITRVALFRDGTQIDADAEAGFDLKVAYTASGSRVDRFEIRGYNSAGTEVASATRDVTVRIGRVLYVCECGSDGANGLTEQTPRRTLQSIHGLTMPGDSVLVMNGTYTNSDAWGDILTITRSGEAGAEIAWIGFPGHTPLLRGRNWNALTVAGASHIIIEGLTLEGNRAEVTLAEAQANRDNLNNPITSGNGIGVIASRTDPNRRPRFVTVRGNMVRDFPGGGIFTYGADHVTIEDNVVLRNAWYSPYANSGISTYQSWNPDNSTGVKMIIRRNISSENHNYIPFYFTNPGNAALRTVTDGNGIIIDDHKNTQNNSTLGVYRGRTLIENNIMTRNGGRAINVFESEHVDIVNNSSWGNAIHPDIEAEFFVGRSSDVNVRNSIFVAWPEKPAFRFFESSAITVSNSIFAGGNGSGTPGGSDNSTSSPMYVNAEGGNLRLQAGSPAIDRGTATGAPATDIERARRPKGAGVDIGAYESF